MMPKTIIHLLSGGMHSVTLLYDLHAAGDKVHALLFDYGQRHVQELEWARFHCKKLDVLFTMMTLPQLKGSELTDGKGGVVIPNRNAVLLSLAVNLAVEAKADTVTYACNADDERDFPDCRQQFVNAMNRAVEAAGYSVEICAPYIDKPKWWIAERGRSLGVPLEQTWSCYRGGEKPCAECPACVKREAAMAKHYPCVTQ